MCSLRKIYIAERCSLEPAPGPKNSQSCQILGNSEKTWKTHYDIGCNSRDCQAAADSSLVWREAMLTSGRKKVVSLEDDVVVGLEPMEE